MMTMTTKEARSETAIAAEIERKSKRRQQIETRSADVRSELAQLRDSDLAEGDSGSVMKDAPARIRQLTEESESLTRTVALLDATLLELDGERREAVISAKRDVAAAHEREAIAIGKELHSLIESLGAQILSVADRLEVALKAAQATQHDHDKTRGYARGPADRTISDLFRCD
jgi:hypothetical protein